jgi:hypothetical protein
MLGIEPSSPMEGQDLSVLFEGRNPEPRDHFSVGYRDYVWVRDKRHVMLSRNDGSEPRLYDAQSDPEQERDLANEDPAWVEEMFEDYVLKDAGGSLSPL